MIYRHIWYKVTRLSCLIVVLTIFVQIWFNVTYIRVICNHYTPLIWTLHMYVRIHTYMHIHESGSCISAVFFLVNICIQKSLKKSRLKCTSVHVHKRIWKFKEKKNTKIFLVLVTLFFLLYTYTQILRSLNDYALARSREFLYIYICVYIIKKYIYLKVDNVY